MKKHLPKNLIINLGSDFNKQFMESSSKKDIPLFFEIHKELDPTLLKSEKLFITKPEIAWAYYGQKLEAYNKVDLHSGYTALKNLCSKFGDNFAIITSGKEGFASMSGINPNRIEELDGNIFNLQCAQNCSDHIWRFSSDQLNVDLESQVAQKYPTCKKCGSAARPNILLEEDSTWNPMNTNEQKEIVRPWIKQIQPGDALIMEIGTSESDLQLKMLTLWLKKKLNAKAYRLKIPRESFQQKKSLGQDFFNPFKLLSLNFLVKESEVDQKAPHS